MTTTPRTAVEALADALHEASVFVWKDIEAFDGSTVHLFQYDESAKRILAALPAGWRLTNEAADERLRAALEAVSPFDPNDRITAINGTVREPRTPADYVEAYRNRILQVLANSEPKR